VVKTIEETITIDSDHQAFRLLSEIDLSPYKDIYRFMHIALRDGRNHNRKKSLIGTIQASLAYGPIYFNAYPNLQISLQDENSLSSLMLNVKHHGYDYMPGTNDICICYRIFYKLLHTLNPMCKVIDFKIETILIETNFGKSKVVTRRPIRWEEIDFSQEWVIEGATQPKNNINDEVSEIEQLNDGAVKIRISYPISMHNRSDDYNMSSSISRSNSSYISPINYIVQVPSRASTSQIRENYRCGNIQIDQDNIGSSTRAKIAKYFRLSKWKSFRKWFFNNLNDEEQYGFQEEFYRVLIESGQNALHNYISMIERDFTLSNGEITKSVFPPLASFQINKNDRIVNFNAFSKLFENDTA
ncbi:hypothetical protein H5410_060497, partial [Solanum commersonii]